MGMYPDGMAVSEGLHGPFSLSWEALVLKDKHKHLDDPVANHHHHPYHVTKLIL